MIKRRIRNAIIVLILLGAMIFSTREVILSNLLMIRIIFTLILLLTFWFLPSYVFISTSKSEERELKNPDSKSAQYKRWMNQGRRKDKSKTGY